ncbi:MAG TPA: hypothetical protein VLE97_10975 [Gaiellaceae bacterium]|nr:hypothetical protein [Gaiellaceae bacterium]
MAKKTAAQLDRDIADVLTKPRGKQVAQAARRANDQIYDLIHGRYFQSIPLDQIFGIVEAVGFHFDSEEKQVILAGRDGKATWDLYWEPGRTVDHKLVLTWHKMDVTGRYEVVAYVS